MRGVSGPTGRVSTTYRWRCIGRLVPADGAKDKHEYEKQAEGRVSQDHSSVVAWMERNPLMR